MKKIIGNYLYIKNEPNLIDVFEITQGESEDSDLYTLIAMFRLNGNDIICTSPIDQANYMELRNTAISIFKGEITLD